MNCSLTISVNQPYILQNRTTRINGAFQLFSYKFSTKKSLRQKNVRFEKVKMNGFGKGAMDSWLDIAKFVAQPSSQGSVFETLSSRIGDRVYADMNGWHIYLRDLKINENASMADMLANQIGTSPKEELGSDNIDALLKKVPMRMGGGKSIISLYDVVPQFALGDLYQICEDYVDDRL